MALELTILLVILTLGGIILAITVRDVASNVACYEAIAAYNSFKIGDLVQVCKHFGQVVDITRIDTILMTPDNAQTKSHSQQSIQIYPKTLSILSTKP